MHTRYFHNDHCTQQNLKCKRRVLIISKVLFRKNKRSCMNSCRDYRAWKYRKHSFVAMKISILWYLCRFYLLKLSRRRITKTFEIIRTHSSSGMRNMHEGRGFVTPWNCSAFRSSDIPYMELMWHLNFDQGKTFDTLATCYDSHFWSCISRILPLNPYILWRYTCTKYYINSTCYSTRRNIFIISMHLHK